LLNLMTNAYTACQQVNRERIIAVALQGKTVNKIDGFELTVADTGPGIDSKFKEMIWQPLFTTKVDREGKEIGTGLGLTIVQSIVEELGGAKKVDSHPKLKGARFTLWIPLA
jgi:two-component system NtrC family sensor kinase